MIQWAPKDPTANQALALVADNNLYYLKDLLNPSKFVKITDNGVNDVILNGVADHLYEEEILEQSRHSAFFRNYNNTGSFTVRCDRVRACFTPKC